MAGSVGATGVTKLPVYCEGIDGAPKGIDELFVGDCQRVVAHLDHLGVVGVILVGRILQLAAGIAGDGFAHSSDVFKIAFDAPETTARKIGDGTAGRGVGGGGGDGLVGGVTADESRRESG